MLRRVLEWLLLPGVAPRHDIPNHGVELDPLALDARKRLWGRWAAAQALVADDEGEQFRGRYADFEVAVDTRAVKGRAQPVVVIADGPSPFVEPVWWKRAADGVVLAHGQSPHEGVGVAMRALFEGTPELVSFRWDSGQTTLRLAPVVDPFAVNACLDALPDLVRAAADAYR